MPDLLNKDSAPTPQNPSEESVKPSTASPSMFGRVPTRRPTSGAPVSAVPAMSGTVEQNPEAESKEKVPKPPSRLFTEYYAASFLLLVAVFIIAGFLVLRPLVNEYKSLDVNIRSTAAILTDERSYLDSLNRSITAAKSIPEQTLADVDEALPRQEGIPKLLQMLAQITSSNGIRLASIQFTAPKPTPATAQAPVADPSGSPEASATGVPSSGNSLAAMDISLSLASPGYANTRRFLDALERNMRVFDVQTIAVTANEQTSDQTYTLQLRAYSLAPGATSPRP